MPVPAGEMVAAILGMCLALLVLMSTALVRLARR